MELECALSPDDWIPALGTTTEITSGQHPWRLLIDDFFERIFQHYRLENSASTPRTHTGTSGLPRTPCTLECGASSTILKIGCGASEEWYNSIDDEISSTFAKGHLVPTRFTTTKAWKLNT